MTDLDLAAVKRAAENATPGPWFRDYGDVVISEDDPRDRFEDEPRPARVSCAAEHRELRDPQAIADAKFIAGARTWVPALVAEVERLERENRQLREAVAAALDEHEPLATIITGIPPTCPTCQSYDPCATKSALAAVAGSSRTDGDKR